MALLSWMHCRAPRPSLRISHSFLFFFPTFLLPFQRVAIMGQLSLNAERVPLAKLALASGLQTPAGGNDRGNGPGPGSGQDQGPVVKSESENFVCAVAAGPCLMCT